MVKSNPSLTRPLSPFMHYDKWPAMFLSILHRITGLAMTAGALLLVYWLTAAAMGAQSYARAQTVFACWPVQLILIGLAFSFCYHLLNGIRHLVWDAGKGFDLKVARASGLAVLLGAVAFAALIVAVFCMRGGAA